MNIAGKQEIINEGLDYLHAIGTEEICRVCISYGGSCCKGCRYLKENEGCQLRNTSCTAWLCGFQQYLFLELGLLDHWEEFWNQIPGQDFRRDHTPATVTVTRSLDKPDPRIKKISAAFARDLEAWCRREHSNISLLNYTLDSHILKLSMHRDSEVTRFVLKRLKAVMRDFKQFKAEKDMYTTDSAKTTPYAERGDRPWG